MGVLSLKWPIAILDIGSNTIRLSVYSEGNVKKAFFNEKVACALGQDLEKTGRLHPGAKQQAAHAIAGFIHISQALKCKSVHALATSAVRDARDGKTFIAALCQELKISIRIISGAEEAHYAALSVISHLPKAKGTVADLGGGSLELASIASGRVYGTITLPLGTLRLSDHKRRLQPWIANHLAAVPEKWGRDQPLYAVGGICRTIASVHSQMQDKPGKFKNYTMDQGELLEVGAAMQRMRPEHIVRQFSVDLIRARALPEACLLLAQVMQRIKASELVVTTRGLTDGYLFSLIKRRKSASGKGT